MQLRISLLQCSLLVLVVAAHFSLSKLAASSNDSVAAILAFIYVFVLAFTIQRLFRLSILRTAIVAYPAGLLWAILFGITYSYYHRALPPIPFDLNTWDKRSPAKFAKVCFEAMLVLGLISCVGYVACATATERLAKFFWGREKED